MKKVYTALSIDVSLFNDLVGLGCTVPEICFAFRDIDTGIPIKATALSKWCRKYFGVSLETYIEKFGGASLRSSLRKFQIDLSAKATPMAVFLGKNILSQASDPLDNEILERIEAIEKETFGDSSELGEDISISL